MHGVTAKTGVASLGDVSISQQLAEQAERERRRLTAMMILVNAKGEVGIGLQNNFERNWSPPQGRVKGMEDVESGAMRELKCELSLLREHLATGLMFLFAGSVEYPEDRIDDLFPRGKLYACFCARLRPGADKELVVNEEMSKFVFVTPEDAKLFCIEQPNARKWPEETRKKGKKIILPAIDSAYIRFGLTHLLRAP